MLLDLSPLVLLIFFVLCIWCFDYYVMGRSSFLVQTIWSSVGYLYVHGHLFRLALKIFTGPLSWESSLSSIPIILRFGLLIVSWISWMFWVRIFLHFAFSLIIVSMFSMDPLHLRFSLLSLVFCWWCLHLWFLVSFLGFLSPGLSHFVISLLFLFPFLDPGWFCSILLPVWLCFPMILERVFVFPL